MTESSASRVENARSQFAEEYVVEKEPFYLPIADEIELFEAAYAARLPILLKGPTGCGKTRFVEFMAWKLGKKTNSMRSLVTISCHEDLTGSDLVGRYLLNAHGTEWLDGPLTRAVRQGGLCYLDEVVEARKDTTVIIHSLTDYRRVLPIEKRGEVLSAHPDFLLIVSYNPGYQSTMKDLKHSTRQRFVSIEFDYPTQALEEKILTHEAGLDSKQASLLALLGKKVRNLDEQNLLEGPSTRLLIYAGTLISQGVSPRRACAVAIGDAMTDDALLQKGIKQVVEAIFDE